MIEREAKLFHYNDFLEAEPEPYPFDTLKTKVETSSDRGSLRVFRNVVQAMVAYANSELQEDASLIPHLTPYRAAIGMRVKGKIETIFCEYQGRNDEEVDLIVYDPGRGKLEGLSISNKESISMKYHIRERQTDNGAAIIASWMPKLLEVPEYLNSYEAVKNFIADPGNYGSEAARELVNEHFALFSSNLQRDLMSDGIANFKPGIETETYELDKLDEVALQRGELGPSSGKVLQGTLRFFKEGAVKKEKAGCVKVKKEYDMDFARTTSDFTEEELAMIPTVPEHHVETADEAFVLNELEATWNNPILKKISVVLFGPSSSGKSHLAEIMAARLHRPHIKFVCDPYLDSSTVFGALLPEIDDPDAMKKAVTYGTLDGFTYENLPDLPDYIEKMMPSEVTLLFDPVTAYQQMTGKLDMDVSEMEVVRAARVYEAELAKKYNAFKEAEYGKREQAVGYKYYKSPIVRAIENGWLIEIQEFNVPRDPAIFTRFNNVFDVTSDGLLETPYGVVKRHPDFIAVFTANDQYEGTREVHQSILARAGVIRKVSSPKEEDFMNRLKKVTGIENKEILGATYGSFEAINEEAKRLGCPGEVTMREAYRFANALDRGVPYDDACQYLLIPVTRDDDDIAELKQFVDSRAKVFCA